MPSASPLAVQLNDLVVDVSLSGVAQGDVLYRGASKWNNLAAGTSGYFLKSNGPGANPSWAAVTASPGGSSGQLQYNNAGAFGGLASTSVATSGSLITVTAPAATDVPLTLTGHASQTANLVTLKKDATTVAYIAATGNLFVNAPSIPSGSNLLTLQYLSANKFIVDYGGNTTIQGSMKAQVAAAGYSIFTYLQAGDHLNVFTSSPPFVVNSADTTTAPNVRMTRSSTTTVGRAQCDIHTDWIVNTDATRTSRVRIGTYYTSTLQEGLRIDSSATQARLAIGGNTSASARLVLYSGQTTDVGVQIQLASGTPTADAFQVTLSDGTTKIAYVDASGGFTTTKLYLVPTPGSNPISTIEAGTFNGEINIGTGGAGGYLNPNNRAIQMPSNGKFVWTATTTSNGSSSYDTGLARDSAGKVVLTDGSTGAGSLVLRDAGNIETGTTTGTKIGTATTQKIGFWNATPVVQQVLATGAGASVDDVITFLQTIGLCKQS